MSGTTQVPVSGTGLVSRCSTSPTASPRRAPSTEVHSASIYSPCIAGATWTSEAVRDDEPSSQGVLYVDLQAFVEPGRFLDFDGLPRLEATDDRGRPVPPPSAGAEWPRPHDPSSNVPGAIGVLQWRLPLGLPDPQAVELRRLRGTLPVIVSATRPDPLVISLDDAPGKSYRHEETTLRFRIIQDSPLGVQIEVILTQDPSPTTSRDDRAQGALHRRFGFEDRAGHPLSSLPQFQYVGPDKETHIQMMIGQGERPIRLRFHGLVWSATEIPFEFAAVPLP